MTLKSDTLALCAVYERLDGSDVDMLVVTRGCAPADRVAIWAALAQRFAEIGLVMSACDGGEIRITIRHLRVGSDGETIDRPYVAWTDLTVL